MHRGYIKLWRKIEDWEWFDDSLTLWFFIRLMFMSNWEDKKWHGVEIKRGQFVSSVENLRFVHGYGKRSKRLTTMQVRTLIERLKSTNELTTEPNNRFTLFTIVNYRKYQDSESSETTSDATNEQQTNNKRTTTTKECKNVSIEEYPIDFLTFWDEYPKKTAKKAALNSWKKVKPSNGLFEKIIQAVKNQKTWPQWNRDDGQYIPNPATWINQGRWDDVYEDRRCKKCNDRGKFVTATGYEQVCTCLAGKGKSL